MTIKIAIADDHQMFRDGIKSLLDNTREYVVVGEAKDGIELLALVKQVSLDVVLLDINMPKMNGLEAIKKLKSDHSEIKVIMLTMFNTNEYINKLLKSGADGYVLKNTGKEELEEAINTVVSGESFFSNEVKQTVMDNLQNKPQIEPDFFQVELTSREKEVLSLIVKEYTTNEIAEKLFISPHTVETYRKNLTSKLPVKNIAGLVRYAIQMGLVD